MLFIWEGQASPTDQSTCERVFLDRVKGMNSPINSYRIMKLKTLLVTITQSITRARERRCHYQVQKMRQRSMGSRHKPLPSLAFFNFYFYFCFWLLFDEETKINRNGILNHQQRQTEPCDAHRSLTQCSQVKNDALPKQVPCMYPLYVL